VLFLCRFGNDGNPKSFGSTDDNFLGVGTVVGYAVYFVGLFLCRFGKIGNPKSFGSTDESHAKDNVLQYTAQHTATSPTPAHSAF
jgi:hypothetical protein